MCNSFTSCGSIPTSRHSINSSFASLKLESLQVWRCGPANEGMDSPGATKRLITTHHARSHSHSCHLDPLSTPNQWTLRTAGLLNLDHWSDGSKEIMRWTDDFCNECDGYSEWTVVFFRVSHGRVKQHQIASGSTLLFEVKTFGLEF